MNTARVDQPLPGFEALRDIISNAIRYWELRRLFYNLILTGVVIAWLVETWPHFRAGLTFESFVIVLVLAVIANVCYCAAYLVDIPMQLSTFQAAWRRWRWTLWLLGTLFAVVLANYWIADEIYPYVVGAA